MKTTVHRLNYDNIFTFVLFHKEAIWAMLY